jgi:hypothetical protein
MVCLLASFSLPPISAFKSDVTTQRIRLTVWRVDCNSGSVVRRKAKNSKEIDDHGKSKDSEKGKEARISEAARQARPNRWLIVSICNGWLRASHELAVALPRAAVPGTAALFSWWPGTWSCPNALGFLPKLRANPAPCRLPDLPGQGMSGSRNLRFSGHAFPQGSIRVWNFHLHCNEVRQLLP